MFTTEITGFEEEPLFFDDANNSVHIAKGATAVGGIGEQLKDPTGIHDNSYLIDGSLQNNGTAIGIAGAHDTVSVGETGHVFGASVGIDLSGNANRVSNSGEIVGASYAAGILVSGGTGTHIRNDGLITGGVGVNFEGDNGLLVNGKSGVITGNTFAIGSSSDETGNITFVNHGLIIGSSGTAFQSESKTVILINDGTIKGDVDFGDGGGTFDNRGGVIKGAINGGAGDDTLITDNAKYHLAEQPDHGVDAVRSTVSYMLNANVEVLALIGKADADATGNSGDNQIFGNAGDNIVKGAHGHDLLDGGKGHDILFGGGDADAFFFAAGTGDDVVRDCHVDEDLLWFSGWRGVHDADDVLAHAHNDHGSTVIEVGSDSVTLRDVHLADLHNAHFMFTAQ